MKCPNCGSTQPDEKSFCSDCGANLHVEAKVSETPKSLNNEILLYFFNKDAKKSYFLYRDRFEIRNGETPDGKLEISINISDIEKADNSLGSLGLQTKHGYKTYVFGDKKEREAWKECINKLVKNVFVSVSEVRRVTDNKKSFWEEITETDNGKSNSENNGGNNVIVEQHNHSCLGGCGTLILIVIIIGLIGSACNHNDSNDKQNKNAATSSWVETENKKDGFTEVSFDELYEEYEKNPIRAEKNYKKIKITGKLNRIDTDLHQISIEDSHDSSHGITASYSMSSSDFKKSIENKLMNYNIGDNITLYVTMKDMDTTGIILTFFMNGDLEAIE